MTNTQLANIAPSDNFAAAAEASQANAIVGERLRFSKGLYLVGRGDGVRLAEGTELQAIDIQAAWVKFGDGKIVDQRIGFPMCGRDELDDNDEEDWPLGYGGAPSDPWSNQRYLYLIDPGSGAEYTFVTSSWGGRAAIEALARQVYVKRATLPGALATVRLEIGHRRSPQYGNVPAPKFEVVGWTGGDGRRYGVDEPVNKGNNVVPINSVKVELDDEVPF